MCLLNKVGLNKSNFLFLIQSVGHLKQMCRMHPSVLMFAENRGLFPHQQLINSPGPAEMTLPGGQAPQGGKGDGVILEWWRWSGFVFGSGLLDQPPCTSLPRGGCVMYAGDKGAQRRGLDRGGEERMERERKIRQEVFHQSCCQMCRLLQRRGYCKIHKIFWSRRILDTLADKSATVLMKNNRRQCFSCP